MGRIRGEIRHGRRRGRAARQAASLVTSLIHSPKERSTTLRLLHEELGPRDAVDDSHLPESVGSVSSLVAGPRAPAGRRRALVYRRCDDDDR